MPEKTGDGRPIHVVGVEPEGPDPDRLPLSELLGRCTLISGGRRHLEKISSRLPRDAVFLPITNNVPDVLQALESFAKNPDREDRIALVLATGDPLYYGIGRQISESLPRRWVSFTPATTLVQRAFALMGEPWDDVHVASIHSRKEAPVLLSDGKWAFYTDGPKGPGSLVEMVFRQGYKIMSMTVLEEIGLDGQRMGTWERVTPSTVFPYEFKSLNIVVMTLTGKENQV